MDIKKIRELIDLMEEKDLASLEIGSKDTHVSLTRNVAVQTMSSPQIALPTTPTDTPKTTPTPKGKTEDSPMVGVFYSAPSPNDPPFVKVGQSVQKGDQLGIIEAMKIMNPIEATQDGVIAEVLVNNGDVVQFGQPIFCYKS